MRQRVTDAVSCPKSAASVDRRQRRMAMPIVLEFSVNAIGQKIASLVLPQRFLRPTAPAKSTLRNRCNVE
jgi:hypothetical protein